jgi:hypothetical protein
VQLGILAGRVGDGVKGKRKLHAVVEAPDASDKTGSAASNSGDGVCNGFSLPLRSPCAASAAMPPELQPLLH